MLVQNQNQKRSTNQSRQRIDCQKWSTSVEQICCVDRFVVWTSANEVRKGFKLDPDGRVTGLNGRINSRGGDASFLPSSIFSLLCLSFHPDDNRIN